MASQPDNLLAANVVLVTVKGNEGQGGLEQEDEGVTKTVAGTATAKEPVVAAGKEIGKDEGEATVVGSEPTLNARATAS